MGVEIERKFLVKGDEWRTGATPLQISQGYVTLDAERSVRVRIAGEQGFLSVKSLRSALERAEFEYAIPVADAEQMIEELCFRPVVKKTRWLKEFAGRLWEIDEFHGENEGLIVAEVELGAADDAVELPSWVGAEVSSDPRYLNANLVRAPFATWKP